jgi:CDP-diacylglycerol--glycerol-3-phosphate 3-phosphatidyltransferase
MQVLQRIKDSGQLANTLTWIRIAFFWVPAALIITHPNDTGYRWWSVVSFMIIAATDMLDGIVARCLQQTSKLGQIIDPLADKLLVVSLLVALCWTDILASPWGWTFFAVNLAREAGVTLLRFQRKHGKANLVIPADKDGKRKMILQSVGIGLALIPIPYWWWPIFIWTPLIASLFYSVRSGISYLRAN